MHTLSRDDVLGRYRRYRGLRTDIQTAALKNVSRSTFLAHAKRIGLGDGKRLFTDDHIELTLVYDLAVYTAKRGQTRAIDRYARLHSQAAESDEALVLAALCASRFSLFRVIEKSELAGVLFEDLMRGGETWLVDEGLEQSANLGEIFAMRVAPIDAFVMTCGAVVPIDAETGDELVGLLAGGGTEVELTALADDPRFALSVYKLAVELELMSRVTYL
jgi:hypothetical protein